MSGDFNEKDEQFYMRRCIQLAQMGAGKVAPNPMVGAVLVYQNRIIGEGFHQSYGGPHAEVNCLGSVSTDDASLIPLSIMYVSLEPCAHFGKTPPCADLIIRKRIPKVVIGCRDPFIQVNGKGIERLQAAGVNVKLGVLEDECRDLNKRFFTFHEKHRPYVILKWAQTADGFIASDDETSRLHISNEYSNIMVHQWRSEESAILVGTDTALKDDPRLTTRLVEGSSPLRLVIDRKLRLPASLHLFDSEVPTIVFTHEERESRPGLTYVKIEQSSMLTELLRALHERNILSVIVEGGASLISSFVKEGLWDEARVITNNKLTIGQGVVAPQTRSMKKYDEKQYGSDTVTYYKPGLV